MPLGGKPYLHLALACANPEATAQPWHRSHAAAEAATELRWHVRHGAIGVYPCADGRLSLCRAKRAEDTASCFLDSHYLYPFFLVGVPFFAPFEGFIGGLLGIGLFPRMRTLLTVGIKNLILVVAKVVVLRLAKSVCGPLQLI